MVSAFQIYPEEIQFEKNYRESRMFSNITSQNKMALSDGKENINRGSKPVILKEKSHSYKKDEGNKSLQRAQPSELPITSYINKVMNQSVEKSSTVTQAQSQIQGKTKEQSFMMPQKLSSNTKVTANYLDECSHKNVTGYRCQYCKDCGIFLPKGNVQTLRESHYKRKLNSNPDRVLRLMLDSQNKNRPSSLKAGFLECRKILVEWICEVSEDLKYSSDTIHIAVSYLECVLNKLELVKEKLQLIALLCVYIAGKFNEAEFNAAKIRDIHEFARGAYSMDLLEKTELMILEVLEWKVRTITPLQFIESFLVRGIMFSSDSSSTRAIDNKCLRTVRKYTEFFADLALQEYSFNRWDAHTVACACIAAARRSLGISPCWNIQLTELTTATWEKISSCFNELIRVYQTTFSDPVGKSKKHREPYNPEVIILSSGSKSDVSDKKMSIENDAYNFSGTHNMSIEYESTVDNSLCLAETPYKLQNESFSYGNRVYELSSCKKEKPIEQAEKIKAKKKPTDLQKSLEYANQFMNISYEVDLPTSKSIGKREYNKTEDQMNIEEPETNWTDYENYNIRRTIGF